MGLVQFSRRRVAETWFANPEFWEHLVLFVKSAHLLGAPPTIILCWQPLGPARPTRLSVRRSSHTPWLGVGTFG